jgi:AcrR family transcriptional regulator
MFLGNIECLENTGSNYMSDETHQLVNHTAKIQILDKALWLFGEKGFDGATIREIAESAGVNHALINYHFGSKEALWKSAVDLLFARLNQVLETAAREAADIEDPGGRMRVILTHYIRYCAAHPEHARIMVQESTSENDRLAWAVEHHIASTRAVFEDLFEELFESGTLPRMSKISLRFMLTAACQSIFTLAAEVKLMYGVSTDHESQIEAHIDAVTKLLLRDELTQA